MAKSQGLPRSTPLGFTGRSTHGRIGPAGGGLGRATPGSDHGSRSVTVNPLEHPTPAAAERCTMAPESYIADRVDCPHPAE
jgi:hypothetical protein